MKRLMEPKRQNGNQKPEPELSVVKTKDVTKVSASRTSDQKIRKQSRYNESRLKEYLQARVALTEMIESGVTIRFIAEATGLSENIIKN